MSAIANIENYAKNEYELYLQGRKKPALAATSKAGDKKCPWCWQLGYNGFVTRESQGYRCCDRLQCTYKEKLPPSQDQKAGAPIQDVSIQFDHPNDLDSGNNITDSNFGQLFCVTRSNSGVRKHIEDLQQRSKKNNRPMSLDVVSHQGARVVEESEYNYVNDSGSGNWERVY